MEVHMATVAKPLHRSRVMVAMEALEKEQGKKNKKMREDLEQMPVSKKKPAAKKKAGKK
jgi:hypothetical protein